MERWSIAYGFKLSAPKSAVMLFSKRNITPQPNHKLRLSGHDIPFVHSFKFLGMVFDSRLCFREHIQHVRTKCLKRLNLFRCIIGSTFGADRATLLRLYVCMYRTIVLPIIEYGSIVYTSASDSILNMLEAQQNAFVRLALGAMRTSPVVSLQIDSGIMPLHIRRMEQTLRYAARLNFTQITLVNQH